MQSTSHRMIITTISIITNVRNVGSSSRVDIGSRIDAIEFVATCVFGDFGGICVAANVTANNGTRTASILNATGGGLGIVNTATAAVVGTWTGCASAAIAISTTRRGRDGHRRNATVGVEQS